MGGKGEDGEETTGSRLLLQSGRCEAGQVLGTIPLVLPLCFLLARALEN
jgi:hypothetical protein